MNNLLRGQRWIPILILCTAVAVLFHRLLLGEVIFWGVPLLQFYPWRNMAFDMLRAGQLPLWNPLVGNGAPLLANYQTAVFYPPDWLYLIIPTEYAMGIVGMLHLGWAGLGMMAYLRRLGVDWLGQGIGAISFALSGYLIGRFGFLSITSAVAWLPWLLWAVEGVMEDGKLRPAGLLAGVITMQLLAGHAQTAFYSLILMGTYAAYRLFFPAGRKGQGAKALMLIAGVVSGVAMAAIQLVPTLELMQTSSRAGGLDPQVALSYSFWPWHFLTFAMPDVFGSPATGNYQGYGAYWEDAVYVGLLTPVLAGAAIVRWWRSRHGEQSPAQRVVPFYAVSLIPVCVLALGWNTPIYLWLFEHVPTFNLFNGPARWMLLAVFGLSVLGGIGADRWRADQRGLVWARRAVVIGMGIGLTVIAVSLRTGDAIRPTVTFAMIRLAGGVCLIGVAALVLSRAERHPRWMVIWQTAVLCLLASDLVTAHRGLNPTIPADYYHQRAALADAIPAGTRALYLPDDEYVTRFDVFLDLTDFQASNRAHWDEMRGSLLPNLGMLDGVPGASNFDPLRVGHHAALLDMISDLPPEEAIERIGQMNAGVLLSPEACDGMDVLGQAGPIFACRVPAPWPRAALALCVPDGDALKCERIAGGDAVITVDEAQRVVVQVSADESAWLVLTDTDYPGWQATVDGGTVAIRRANGAFRAVEVAAGEHEVTFTYRPASLRIGALISGAGLAVWPVLAGVSAIKTGRVQAAQPVSR